MVASVSKGLVIYEVHTKGCPIKFQRNKILKKTNEWPEEENLPIFQVSLEFCDGLYSQLSRSTCSPWAVGWTRQMVEKVLGERRYTPMKAWTEGLTCGFWEPWKIYLTRRAALAHAPVRHRGMMFMGPTAGHFQSLSGMNRSHTGSSN